MKCKNCGKEMTEQESDVDSIVGDVLFYQQYYFCNHCEAIVIVNTWYQKTRKEYEWKWSEE